MTVELRNADCGMRIDSGFHSFLRFSFFLLFKSAIRNPKSALS